MNEDEQKRITADSFGSAAESYLQSATHREGADLDRLAEWCADATWVLDIATGAGHTAGAIAAAGGRHVIAADAAPAMVRTAVDEFAVQGVVSDAERLPFSDRSFDAVACRIAAHHFPDPRAFLAEVARVLKPGGTFALEDSVAPEKTALGTFINEIESMRDSTHVESYSTTQWHEWLIEAGFDIEATHHLKTNLDFEYWTDAQSVPPARKDEIEALLLDADEETKDLFEIDVDDGSVQSFSNVKALIHATRST